MSGLEGLLRGRVLGGRFRIEEVIGRGGMGAVYRAVDERLGRKVAVKVITVAMGDDPDSRRRIRARFHREARAAAALPHHPNVVPVYDYGTDEELGLDYIVMELLQGHDLATRLQRAGPPPLPVALRILREAARGLAVGHRAGLVHRDVKPGNIFLAESGHDEVEVRMVDFGIAKLVDEEDTFNQLTQDGRIPHSPAFASPEQLRGLGQLSPASDVFSLGAVGFQLLTGERPYSEDDRNRMSLGMPVPVPTLRSRNPAVPESVDEVVRRALAYDPVDRFADAVEMALALDRALREMPDPPPDAYPPPAPTAMGMAGAYAPGVLDDDERTQLMGGPSDEDDRTLLAPEGPPPPRAPVLPPPAEPEPARPTVSVAPEPRRGRGALWIWALVLVSLAGVVLWAITDGGGERRLADQLPVPDTLAPDTAAPPAEDSAATPEVDAVAINQDGIRAFQQGRVETALGLFRRALESDPDNAAYHQNVGIALAQLGRADQAFDRLSEAVQRDPALDRAYAYLAQIQIQRGDTAAAIRSLEAYLQRTGDSSGRALAQRQLESLRIEGALLGEPVDTARPPAPPPSAATPP